MPTTTKILKGGGHQVTNVIKQNGVILHELEGADIQVGDRIAGSIDWDRRQQLMQHHSATHLVNGAAKKVLGNHVWQAGAKKTTDKGRLDITHYDQVTADQLEKIEQQANQWIEDNLPVTKQIMTKAEAEQQHGFRIYQGGVPPGNQLRIVEVGDGLDIEACGGTHVDETSEIEEIVVTGTNKIQDGVIRLEFKAGQAARDYQRYRVKLTEQLENWVHTEGRELEEIAGIFDVELDDLPDVIQRFVDEWENQRKEIWELQSKVDEPTEHDYDDRPHDPMKLFKQWKQQQKDIKRLEEKIEQQIKQELINTDAEMVEKDLQIDDVGILIRIARHVTAQDEEKAIVLRGKNAIIAARGDESDYDIEAAVDEQAEVVQPSGNLVKGFKLKH
jgi:alanyl-tRNA synthetase